MPIPTRPASLLKVDFNTAIRALRDAEAEPIALPPVRCWERLAVEADPEWLSWCSFRDLGEIRSLLLVSRINGARLEDLATWQARYRWQDRSKAFDVYLDRIHADRGRALLDAPKAVADGRHLQLIDEVLSLVRSEIAKLRRASVEAEGPTVSASAISRILDQTAKLERLVRGEATERVEISTLDLSKLSDSELATLRDLTLRATRD